MKILIPNIGKVVVSYTENYQPSFPTYDFRFVRIRLSNKQAETHELNYPFTVSVVT